MNLQKIFVSKKNSRNRRTWQNQVFSPPQVTIFDNRFMRSVYLLAHCGRSRYLQKGFALSSG